MERFIVSARKYRPDSFESLIGQSNIATTLKNSILRKQLAHAYLFCGPRGVGKTTTARIFARIINCTSPTQNMEPCGECESCVSYAEGRSYSIHELDAASNNSVDDIRQLSELVRIPPQIGKYSVYIIDEVHMLSQGAFNAFLKTLEEPPAHAIFILATTEKHKILPTILSRCQTYDFNRIGVEDIVNNLIDISSKEGVKYQIEALHVIAQKADGAMRDALTIFDQVVAFCGKDVTYKDVITSLNVLDYDYYISLTNMLLKGDHTAVLLLFDEILSKGFNALHFIGGLGSHFRNLLLCKDNSTHKLLELAPSVKERYMAQALSCSQNFLYDALNITSVCEAGYKSSGHQRLHIEISLLKLCRINSPEWIEKETKQEVKQETATELKSQPKPERVASISIKKLISNAENNGRSTTHSTRQVIGKEPLNQDSLNSAWVKMADSESALPRLSTTISQCVPVIKDQNTILFNVKNELQKNWIEQYCKSRLVEFLKRSLNNGEISLEIEVAPDDEVKDTKMYMPEEKAKFLMENYPEVKEMQKDLKLELK